MIIQQQHPIPVPFRDTILYIVEIDGNPYVSMKPIVEGMGLAWQTQYRKLKSNKERWGITIMVIPSPPGGDQETICMPLRKLPGWLMTIRHRFINLDSFLSTI